MRSVLVTGATGSFGRAFVKRLLSMQSKYPEDHPAYLDPVPHRICIFSRGEHAQAAMRAELQNDSRLRFFIGDVRDRDRLRRAMEGVDVVIHAAALKRIEVGYLNPSEMIKTNVGGAMNVIEAAHDAGVRKVVALSTDKAYQPISAYGQSKALAESLFIAANNARGANGPIYSCCRYGNVWGSAGSIVPIWRGSTDPTITSAECTRFFMRMDEAIDLVLDTVRTMKGGELAIPEWLPAYRLGDLAAAMGVNPRETGLSGYEKLHEGMRDGLTSDIARRMSVDELREALSYA